MEVSGQLHAPAALPPVPIGAGDWVGPRAGLDAVAKRKFLGPCREPNPGRSARNQVAIPDWAIPTPRKTHVIKVIFVTGWSTASPWNWRNSSGKHRLNCRENISHEAAIKMNASVTRPDPLDNTATGNSQCARRSNYLRLLAIWQYLHR
jgi:hypothetical protein